MNEPTATTTCRMPALVFFILALSVFAQGCVMFSVKNVEKVPRHGRGFRVSEAPPIQLILHGVSRESFAEVREDFPHLANAAGSSAPGFLLPCSQQLIAVRSGKEVFAVPGEPKHKLDYSDLLAAPDDGKRYELVRADLFVTPSPSPAQETVSSFVLRVNSPADS